MLAETMANKIRFGNGDGIGCQKILLTPELATEFLKKQVYLQRDLQPANLNYYIGLVEQGLWRNQGDPVRFDVVGNMVDGQHRCIAVERTGKSIETVVVTGLTEEDYHYIDVHGAKRTLADSLRHNSESNAGTLAGTLRLLSCYVGASVSDSRWPRNLKEKMPPYNVILEVLKKHPEIAESVACVKNKCKGILPPSTAAFCHYLFAKKDRELADRFFEQLGDGVNLTARDPILYLRNLLIDQKIKKVRFQKPRLIAHVFVAWNLKRANRKKKPAWRTVDLNEPFPTPK